MFIESAPRHAGPSTRGPPRRGKRERQHHVINLGNNISATVPASDYTARPTAARRPSHQQQRQQKAEQHRDAAAIRRQRPWHLDQTQAPSAAAHQAPSAESTPDAAAPSRSASPCNAEGNRLSGPDEKRGDGGAITAAHGTAPPAVEMATTIASAAATAALMSVDAVADALAAAHSSASHAPSDAAARRVSADVDAMRDNFTRLQTVALPQLFAFSETFARGHDTRDELTGASSVASAPPEAAAAPLTDALRCLDTHLQYVSAAARVDGRHHVPALPPAVVTALWDRVMPAVHQRVFLQPQTSPADVGQEGAEARGIPKHTAAPTATASTLMENSAVAPAAAVKRRTYLSVRRALALHTRHTAPLTPPPALALTLTRMLQCGALADDVMGAIATTHMERLALEGAATSPASPSNPGVREAENGVGGGIAILRARVLRLPGNITSTTAAAAAGTPSPATASSESVAFMGAAAVTVARVLGRAAIPGHHQLHRFFHLALLPELTRMLTRSAAAVTPEARDEASPSLLPRDARVPTARNDAGAMPMPSAAALLDLTTAMRHYAVSGKAVASLTALWRAHFTSVAMADGTVSGASASAAARSSALEECAAVLRAVSTTPSLTSAAKTERRRKRSIHHSSEAPAHLQRVAEEDYLELIDVVCAHVCRLCCAAPTDPSTDERHQQQRQGQPQWGPPPQQLLALMGLLLRVNSLHWAETYVTLADAVLDSLTSAVAAAHVAPAAGGGGGGEHAALVEGVLPLEVARRTLTALLHRNSLIPDHPLHRVLLRRLLHAPEALTDAAVAGRVLLGLELMFAPDEPAEGAVQLGPRSGPQETGTATAASGAPPSSTAPALVQAPSAPASRPALLQILSAAPITGDDRARALRVFRRLGRTLAPTAFVAGLCVTDLSALPRPAQTAVVNHFTSVASAISPTYLVKGMEALMRQLPAPTVVDDVSVQQWFSRFTARDVVRRVDAAGCAALLDMLSAQRVFARNCALAKESITRRLGTALRVPDDGVESVSSGGVTLAALPRVVAALQRADVFLPVYYSRVCRLMLGKVEQAPLGDLLEPFAITADAYMSRQRNEAQASVFKDVWELLRGRVVQEAATLTLAEVLTALNAFAALDVADRPLFSVLVYALWTCVGKAEADLQQQHRPHPHQQQHSQHDDDAEDAPAAAATAAAHEVRLEESADAAEAAARRRAEVGQKILRTLTPSAVAVVADTLLARDDVRASLTAPPSAASADTLVGTLLPWMLLGLRQRHAELYPIDVVHVLPAVLRHYTSVDGDDGASDVGLGVNAALARGAYDACRGTFLEMYALLPDTLADADGVYAAEATLSASARARITELRAEWTAATRMSIEVVPRRWFVTVLIALSSASLLDAPVALACVRRACTQRVCVSLLPVGQLVDLCLSLCWLHTSLMPSLVSPDPSTARTELDPDADLASPEREAASSVSSPAADPSSSAKTAAEVLRTGMATVLSALWHRSDELASAHIHALLRCLRTTYGADKVDADFTARLENQLSLLRQQRPRTTAQDAAVPASRSAPGEPAAASAAPTEPPPPASLPVAASGPPQAVNVSADDLFGDV